MANYQRNNFYAKLRFIETIFILLFFVLCNTPATSALAATVNLAWKSSTGSNVAGYKMYYGTSSGNYSYNVKVGNSTSCSLSSLQEGKKYYFAATAYNSSNVESAYSPEFSYTVPTGSSSSSSSSTSSSGSSSSTSSSSSSSSTSSSGSSTPTSSSGSGGSTTEIIIDNGGVGTSSSGTWKTSGGSNSFGNKSVYSKSAGATYTFQTSRSGDQDVYLWYTYYDSRYTNVPVKIYNGSSLLHTVYVDQQQEQNAGNWYFLGTYHFSGTAKVMIESQSSSASTCADAVKFAPAGSSSSSSSGPGVSTTTSIIDNGGSGTSSSGSWKTSGGLGPYGTNSLYSKTVGATYTFQSSRSGNQDVYIWYTYYASRYTNVPVKIYNGSTLLKTVYVDQQQKENAGNWYYIGTYNFSGTAKVVIESKSSSASTSADAVKFAPAVSNSSSTSGSATAVILDNGGSGTSSSGSWKTSGGLGLYGTNSLYSKTVGATYTFQSSCSGNQDVYIWYTYYASRYTNVPVKIYNGATLLQTVYVDQQQEQNAGKWYYIGTYSFSGTAKVVIESKSSSASTSADAVKFVPSSSGPSTCALNAKFKETPMKVGAYYYTDRSYTITGGVSNWANGLTLIQTVNDERSNTSSNGYLKFTHPVDGWVYVLFDSRSSSIPNWLKDWELLSDRITTSLSSQPYLKVYRKQFDAGQCVDLGGNYGSGSSIETRSNYVVVYDK